MSDLDLARAARVAEAAAERARRETLPRFRSVSVETKRDGSPVTEADRAAERVIRQTLREAFPDAVLVGEEYGVEGDGAGPCWLVDPIDGTIAFARGIPTWSTLLTLTVDGQPLLGLIDLPPLDERVIGWRGGGVRRNGELVRVSQASDPRRAIVSHGDPLCFDLAGERPALERLVRETPFLRGYTDAFGHALVVCGSVDVMIDLDLCPWDAGPARALVPEAGGRLVRVRHPSGKEGLVFGSPTLVERLAGLLGAPRVEDTGPDRT